MATKSIAGLEQPIRRLYSEQLFYVFSGVFIISCIFFPALYIPLYLIASTIGYWLARVRNKMIRSGKAHAGHSPGGLHWIRLAGIIVIFLFYKDY
jgi:hypothetical protein